jgi:hypothetical protein
MTMAALAPADHGAGGQVQSGKQRRRVMANIVAWQISELGPANSLQ